MLARIIFFTAVSAATLAVILLATVSPSAQRRLQRSPPSPQLALSMYVQHAHLPSHRVHAGAQSGGALVFHHMLTEGPKNMSRIIGKAQGFIIPLEHFAHSAFNIIYLTFHTAEYSGSISIEAKLLQHRDREELEVVGGTGSFAFARGRAVFTRIGRGHASALAMYHVKLHLQFPDDRSQTIPG
ncbi:hypothetical protein Taro_002280 [Colocasia esculenta]|uniref:Dirigent protein n=1 Tax=Colocasia esculenta TaxID=4460 RepID=A0A843TIN0_COLES|nr:hypothetical protein [Colocasia esculenta]